MIWNIFFYDKDAGKIRNYNVLSGSERQLKSLWRKHPDSVHFEEALMSYMMKKYWGKPTFELSVIALNGDANHREERKIDAWEQIYSNWTVFLKYVIDCVSAQQTKSVVNINY